LAKREIAIVGAETLLGRDLRESFEAAKLPAEVKLYHGEESGGILTEVAGEPTVIGELEATAIRQAAVLVLAGSAEASEKTLDRLSAKGSRPVVIDVSGALDDRPGSRLRAPLAEYGAHAPEKAEIQVIAHPASTVLAMFLRALQRVQPMKGSIATLFEPASERGKRGIDELQKQTVNLLSFKKMPTEVFDAQLSFSLLSRYGEDAPLSLGDIELRIERNLASLLGRGEPIPMPSLRLIQAPAFHGYSMSVWVEFQSTPDPAALAQDLASDRIEVREPDQEPPTNVGVAGQSGITVGSIAVDRNNPRACWFWIVADNLRISAENAAEVAREALA